ncbi:hypothetical protein DIPPA_35619 [Diplonema papillatum]|nr:hypothetical protein DIPPA_35619 [Diplonema papillatum]
MLGEQKTTPLEAFEAGEDYKWLEHASAADYERFVALGDELVAASVECSEVIDEHLAHTKECAQRAEAARREVFEQMERRMKRAADRAKLVQESFGSRARSFAAAKQRRQGYVAHLTQDSKVPANVVA